MTSSRRVPASVAAFVPALVVAFAAAPLLASHAERPVEQTFSGDVKTVRIENLAGRIEIRHAPAGRVAATVFAEDSAGKTGEQWTKSLEIEIEQSGDRLVVKAIYPLDDTRRIHYPALSDETVIEPQWLARWLDVGSASTEYQGHRVHVVGKPGSGAATLWADFTLEVPDGVAVTVANQIGRIRSNGVTGDQKLDSASGDIVVADSRGVVDADTGSGNVSVTRHTGDVLADTGSGDVELDTVTAERISADTGSGDIDLSDCSGAIDASTGSGDVIGESLRVGRRLKAETGSGDVKLAGDFAAVRDLTIDTGSGDVSLVFSATPSVQLTVSTGSGDIDVDVRAMRIRRSHDEFVADLGAAEGNATIDTGSGDVSLREGR